MAAISMEKLHWPEAVIVRRRLRLRVRITASGEAREIKPVMVGRRRTIHAFSSTSTARREWRAYAHHDVERQQRQH
jgi:hypothetical protein